MESGDLQKGKSANRPIRKCAHLPICLYPGTARHTCSTSGAALRGMCASLLIFLFALLCACTQTPIPTIPPMSLTLVADTSTAPLMDELIEVYLADRPHVTIRLEYAANAERTLEALRAGQFDAASVSWLPEEEKSGGTLWQLPFARSPIVMITHPTNPIGGLTLLQLRNIFQGQALFWDDLGGLALDVIPVSREDGSGMRLSFESLVMGGHGVTPTSVVMYSNEAVVEYVSATPGAIGYVSPGWLVPAVNLLAVEGTTPSPASVADGRYLLAFPFYIVARTAPSDGLADFVDWMRSEKGQEIVERRYASMP
jgi:phosphate transport system substrate-binding protein